MKKLLILFVFFSIALPTLARAYDVKYYNHWKTTYHPHNEASYQQVYCSMHNGIEEYELPDKTRVDCLTETHAIEFDFAAVKWAESIGQSAWYGLQTGKKPKVVLILDSKYKKQQMVYVDRVKKIGEVYGIEVEYVSDEILNLDKDGKCQNPTCKCHKPKKRKK